MGNLKVGDTVKMLHTSLSFYKGQILKVYRLCDDGIHLLKGDNITAYVNPNLYEKLDTVTACTIESHPHADLMLKYAMIAQYDDKPWEQFEYLANNGTWVTKNESSPFRSDAQYRLKPQPPVVQVGQTWVSPEGITVQVQTVLPVSSTVMFKYLVGGVNQVQCMNTSVFSKVFKRKE